MTAPRRMRGPRASALFPVLAYAVAEGLSLLDDTSLAFGFLCKPLPAGDQGEADRLPALLNQDWPKDTLLQVMPWASPDIEEPLARMRGLRIEHADALLREAITQRAELLRRGTDAALGLGSELRVRHLQVPVTVKLPLNAAIRTETELNDAAELRVGAQQVLSTAGLKPEPLTADRYVRLLLNTLLNWGEGSGKSFLTNELLATTLSVGWRCWVIDVGRPYEDLCANGDPQHFLYFFPLPHGQGSLRPTFRFPVCGKWRLKRRSIMRCL